MKQHFILGLLILLFIFIIGCTAREELTDINFFEEELRQAKEEGVKKDDLPFAFITNSDTAVLLIHGLTATPWEVRELGIYLAQNNVTVYAPILEGHGTSFYDLERTRWEEWYREVENSYNALSQNANHIYVVGVSMGADLALLLGADKDFRGIVLIGAPIWLKDRRSEFAWLYKNLRRYRFVERNVSERDKGHYYELIPAHSVNELMKIILQVRKNLKKVDEPLLIIQSNSDETVNPKSAEFIFEKANSLNKTIIWKEHAPHIAFEENADESFREIYEFISRN